MLEPVATETDCPSCGGLNTSCPDGCGRDPLTGELNGTRLEPAADLVEVVARAIRQALSDNAPWRAEPADFIEEGDIAARAAILALKEQPLAKLGDAP